MNYLKLPPRNRKFVGKTAILTGYGYNKLKFVEDLDSKRIIREGNLNNKLRFAKSKVWDRISCSAERGFEVSRSILCAQMNRHSDQQGACDVSEYTFNYFSQCSILRKVKILVKFYVRSYPAFQSKV